MCYSACSSIRTEGFSLKMFEQAPTDVLIRGEMELLLHLYRTAPFPIQKPVKNRFGKLVTLLSGGTD